MVTAGGEVDSTSVLDGFTITSGHADSTPSMAHHTGGGMKSSGRPVVRNVRFTANTANFGGGMYDSGGATLINVIFENNFAVFGGGVSNSHGSTMLKEVTFRGNTSSDFGGGMYNNRGITTVIGAVFIQNEAGWGGGMYNRQGEQTVINAAFFGNTATRYDGGGIFNDESSTRLTNVVFSGNRASNDGGGMYTFDGSLETVNATLSGNRASNDGGGIYNVRGSLVFTNSILWGNTAAEEGDQIFNQETTPTVAHSLIEGGLPSSTIDGGGNLDADPHFADATGPDAVPGTPDDDLRLRSGSPAIDAGDNSALPPDTLDLDRDGDRAEVLPVDLEGRVRVYDGGSGGAVVDLGAYEHGAPPVQVGTELVEETVLPWRVLSEAYPNPFHGETTLRFTLPEAGRVSLRLYDLLGREVATLLDGALERGVHSVVFDGGSLPSGVYLYRLETAAGMASGKMMLMK